MLPMLIRGLLDGLLGGRHEGESRHDAGAERRQQAEARFQALEVAGAPPGTKCALCHGTEVGEWGSTGWAARSARCCCSQPTQASSAHGALHALVCRHVQMAATPARQCRLCC